MENHVVSLELSKQLKEAGYPQEGEFWYRAYYKGDGSIGDNFELVPKIHSFVRDDGCVAPLASEIMEKLPYCYHVWRGSQENDKGDWLCVRFSEPEFEYDENWEQANTMCDVLAKMYLYLHKEGLLEGGK